MPETDSIVAWLEAQASRSIPWAFAVLFKKSSCWVFSVSVIVEHGFLAPRVRGTLYLKVSA